jgi:hypothetical protein
MQELRSSQAGRHLWSGAEPWVFDNDGLTPIDLASLNGHTALATLLTSLCGPGPDALITCHLPADPTAAKHAQVQSRLPAVAHSS